MNLSSHSRSAAKTPLCAFAILVLLGTLLSGTAFAQVGAGLTVSTLGIGGDVAVETSKKTNIRGGFSLFNYNRNFNKDDLSYTGQLQLRSVKAQLDWFPFGGGFHLSPGAMLYNGNKVNLNEAVAGDRSFTLGNTTYTSNPANPITGTGAVTFKKAAPMLTLGWGNLVPRGSKHFSVPFELGVVLQGSPAATLNLSGSACTSSPFAFTCVSTSDPAVQANIAAEQAKINHDLSPFKYYPIISTGFGIKF